MGLRLLGAALAAWIAVPAHAAEDPGEVSPPPGWENITKGLCEGIPDYRDGDSWWNKRLGKIHVDNVTGDVYVSLCEHWGTYRSTDCGDTWRLVDNQIALGRHVGDLGMFPNPATGDFILFKVNGGKNANKSAVVLERGTRLIPIKNIGDGWNSGMADWSRTPPQTILARQHHSSFTRLSTDGGQTWAEVAEGFRFAAMLDANTIFLGEEYYLLDGRRLKWEQVKQLEESARKRAVRLADIMLTTDRGKTMTKVAQFLPSRAMPARYENDLFWLCPEGVMVTRDRGRTWALMGQPVKEPLLGPYFGNNKDTMVVLDKEGWFRTDNAGQSWQKVAEYWLPDKQEAGWRGGNLRGSWDPIGNVLYIGLLGKDAYRHHLQGKAARD